jgi:hypothetical protein
MLVRTLGLPWAVLEGEDPEAGVYVWPSAYVWDPPHEAWTALEGVYSPEEIAAFEDFGGFIGWRAGITPDGRWRFYLAGD